MPDRIIDLDRAWADVADFIGRRPNGLTEHIFWQRARHDYQEHLARIATEEGHLIDA